ncbi:T9SS type A sorting domain-containing protein [bacterium]|nr:T9SS type A sorting domain-containing protein [bacterium]
MMRKLVVYFTLTLLGLSLSMSIPSGAGAQSVFVSEPNSGNVLKVDNSGAKTIFATGLGRPGPLKFDKNGNLFVIDFEGRLMKVTPDGSVSTFATGLPEGSLNDLLVTDDGKPFLLASMENPVNGDMYGAVWELVENGAPSLLASTVDEAPPGQNGRGFTCGPGGHFYLAMQGGNSGGRIIRITRDGQVSTFFDPGLPPLKMGGGSMIDVRFNSQDEMLILGHVPPGNTRIIWKVQNGALTTFVSPGGIPDQSLQLTIDAADNLFVAGGGFGGCAPSQIDCFEGFVKRVDPLGNVTTLATFPPPAGELMNTIIDVDDDGFDSFLSITVEAGGPYVVTEGASVMVTASGNDPNAGPLTYAWDLDNNGSFETPGQSVTFSAADLDGPADSTIQVQVTNNSGLKATDQATVNISNVAPTATFTGTPGTIIVGQSATLAFSNPLDPSAADVAAGFTYSYDCTNDGTFEVSDVTANSYACAYPASGTFAAKGRIKDKDGDFTDYTAEIVVLPALVANAGADGQICDGQSILIGGNPAASGGTPPYAYSWTPATGLDDATAANPIASPTVTTTYKLTVTDANRLTNADEVTVTVKGTCKRFVFLANTVTLKRTKQSTPAGDIHSNGNLTVEKGDPSTYNSNLTAVGKITINKENTINGNVTSPLAISNAGTVSGVLTVGPVASEPLPSKSYSAGGPNKAVPQNGTLTLAPGSYGIVTLNSGGTLKLTSGDYFLNELRYPGSTAVIAIDLASGEPVNINVVSNLQLGKEVAVRLLPNGESNSELVTFFTLQRTAVNVGKEAYFLGTLHAPNATVTLAKNSQLRGSLCANTILVENDCLFLHHDSPAALPGPGNLPKSAADDEEATSDQSPVTSYQLAQNYPNPFNPSTTIRFSVLEAGVVQLAVYNINGQEVRTLISGQMDAGRHVINWDGKDNAGQVLPSGVYVYKLRVNGFAQTRKMTLMR